MTLTDRMTRSVLWKFNRSMYKSMYGYAWEAVWGRYAPRLVRPVSHAPIKGETLYRDIESGNQSYRMYCLTKA